MGHFEEKGAPSPTWNPDQQMLHYAGKVIKLQLTLVPVLAKTLHTQFREKKTLAYSPKQATKLSSRTQEAAILST